MGVFNGRVLCLKEGGTGGGAGSVSVGERLSGILPGRNLRGWGPYLNVRSSLASQNMPSSSITTA